MARSTPALNIPTRSPSYVVGTQRAERPLVFPEHVKGHIRLLRAFYNLRITVEDCKDRRIPEHAKKMDKDARWRWFVHLAVDRFEQWVKSLRFVSLEKFVTGYIPPMDVWMVWHAYMLSPCWYTEDCERLALLQQMRLLNMFVVGSINVGKVSQLKPSSDRVEAWQKQTGTPFNPFEALTATECKFKQLECPRCRTMAYVPFATDDDTGFAEGNFSAACPLPGCGLKITHDNLAVTKFVRDLAEVDEAQEHYIAGSLFSPSGKQDAFHAKLVRDQLLRSVHFAALRPTGAYDRLARLDQVKDVKENLGYSMERLKEAVISSLKDVPSALVTRVLSAYADGSSFSINLVDAVLRQSHFTEQIDELGWLKSGAFREAHKQEILWHAVIRYHAFLDLMTAYPNTMLVPTLDIDLVWHTHQLMASRYNVDCEMYVGHHVDHELSVTESRLSSSFDYTCRAWQARFQVPYMYCGCPTPEGASLHKFMRLVRTYLFHRPQLQIYLHPEHHPATHPSSHNALLTFQTVGTGSFGKMHHTNPNGKQREERSRSPTHRKRRGRQIPERSNLDFSPRVRSPSMPAYFARELPPLPNTSSHLW